MRNLFFIVLALVVVAVVVSLGLVTVPSGTVQPGTGPEVGSFDSDYVNLKNIWSSYGIGGVRLHAESSALTAMAENQLANLQSDLTDYRAGSSAGAALADAYALLVNKVRLEKAARQTGNLLDAGGDPCLNLDTYSTYTAQLDSTVNAQIAYLDSVNSFVDTYPVEADAIELFKNETWPIEARENADSANESFALLKEVCE